MRVEFNKVSNNSPFKRRGRSPSEKDSPAERKYANSRSWSREQSPPKPRPQLNTDAFAGKYSPQSKARSGKKMVSTYGEQMTYQVLKAQEEEDKNKMYYESKYTGLTALQGVLLGREDSPLRKKHILQNPYLAKSREHRAQRAKQHEPVDRYECDQYNQSVSENKRARNRSQWSPGNDEAMESHRSKPVSSNIISHSYNMASSSQQKRQISPDDYYTDARSSMNKSRGPYGGQSAGKKSQFMETLQQNMDFQEQAYLSHTNLNSLSHVAAIDQTPQLSVTSFNQRGREIQNTINVVQVDESPAVSGIFNNEEPQVQQIPYQDTQQQNPNQRSRLSNNKENYATGYNWPDQTQPQYYQNEYSVNDNAKCQTIDSAQSRNQPPSMMMDSHRIVNNANYGNYNMQIQEDSARPSEQYFQGNQSYQGIQNGSQEYDHHRSPTGAFNESTLLAQKHEQSNSFQSPAFPKGSPQKNQYMAAIDPASEVSMTMSMADDLSLGIPSWRSAKQREPNQSALQSLESIAIEQINSHLGYKDIELGLKSLNMQVSRGNLRKFQEQYMTKQRQENAARMVQKFMKGYLDTRKKKKTNRKQLKKSIYTIADRLSYKRSVPQLLCALRQAHQVVKERKQAILNGYITYCVVKIQKAYKGFKTRSILLPMRRSFGPRGVAKLEAVAQGYVTRRIMQLKDVKMRISLIKDHDIEGYGNDLENKKVFRSGSFKESRKNACNKLVSLLGQLHRRGQWLLLQREEQLKQMSSGTRSQTKTKRSAVRNSVRPGNFDHATMSPVHSQPSSDGHKEKQFHAFNSQHDEKKTKFNTSLKDEQKHKDVKENLKRRMSYNPLLQARLKGTRDNQSPTHPAQTHAAQTYGSQIEPIVEERYVREPVAPAYKKENDEKKVLLNRRLSYIPDPRKRAEAAAREEMNKSPEEFLHEYKQRKELRQQPDIVDKNTSVKTILSDLKSSMRKSQSNFLTQAIPTQSGSKPRQSTMVGGPARNRLQDLKNSLRKPKVEQRQKSPLDEMREMNQAHQEGKPLLNQLQSIKNSMRKNKDYDQGSPLTGLSDYNKPRLSYMKSINAENQAAVIFK